MRLSNRPLKSLNAILKQYTRDLIGFHREKDSWAAQTRSNRLACSTVRICSYRLRCSPSRTCKEINRPKPRSSLLLPTCLTHPFPLPVCLSGCVCYAGFLRASCCAACSVFISLQRECKRDFIDPLPANSKQKVADTAIQLHIDTCISFVPWYRGRRAQRPAFGFSIGLLQPPAASSSWPNAVE